MKNLERSVGGGNDPQVLDPITPNPEVAGSSVAEDLAKERIDLENNPDITARQYRMADEKLKEREQAASISENTEQNTALSEKPASDLEQIKKQTDEQIAEARRRARALTEERDARISDSTNGGVNPKKIIELGEEAAKLTKEADRLEQGLRREIGKSQKPKKRKSRKVSDGKDGLENADKQAIPLVVGSVESGSKDASVTAPVEAEKKEDLAIGALESVGANETSDTNYESNLEEHSRAIQDFNKKIDEYAEKEKLLGEIADKTSAEYLSAVDDLASDRRYLDDLRKLIDNNGSLLSEEEIKLGAEKTRAIQEKIREKIKAVPDAEEYLRNDEGPTPEGKEEKLPEAGDILPETAPTPIPHADSETPPSTVPIAEEDPTEENPPEPEFADPQPEDVPEFKSIPGAIWEGTKDLTGWAYRKFYVGSLLDRFNEWGTRKTITAFSFWRKEKFFGWHDWNSERLAAKMNRARRDVAYFEQQLKANPRDKRKIEIKLNKAKELAKNYDTRLGYREDMKKSVQSEINNVVELHSNRLKEKVAPFEKKAKDYGERLKAIKENITAQEKDLIQLNTLADQLENEINNSKGEMGWGEKRGKKKELAEIRKTLKGMNKMILKYRAGETKEFKRYTKMSKKAGIYTGAISELNTHTQLDQNSKRRLDRSKFGHVESRPVDLSPEGGPVRTTGETAPEVMPTPEMTEADKIEMKPVDFVAEWNKRYGSDPKLGFDLSTFVGVMSPENGAKEKLKLSQLKEALDLRLRLNKVSDSQRKLLINSFIASQSKR